MKTLLIFALGAAVGALVVATLLPFSTPEKIATNSTEIASLKAQLSQAQNEARTNRDALQEKIREMALLRVSARAATTSPAFSASGKTDVHSDSTLGNFLGEPVPAPAKLDPQYAPAEIGAVFRDLAETLGYKIQNITVDTSEFPFLVSGRVEGSAGAGFFKKIDSELRALPGYTYGGSSTGMANDGSTYFALNIIPNQAYPRDSTAAINRRLMVRLQMLSSAQQILPP